GGPSPPLVLGAPRGSGAAGGRAYVLRMPRLQAGVGKRTRRGRCPAPDTLTALSYVCPEPRPTAAATLSRARPLSLGEMFPEAFLPGAVCPCACRRLARSPSTASNSSAYGRVVSRQVCKRRFPSRTGSFASSGVENQGCLSL